MRGRAPLQALQLHSGVHTMAAAPAASGARSVWQRCVCELTGLFRVEAPSAAARAPAAKAFPQASRASFSVGDSVGGVSEQSIFRQSFSWGRDAARGASALASGRIWSPTTTRQCSFAVHRSSISGDRFTREPFLQLNAMPLSTSPVRGQQNASENFPTESVISTEETIVIEAEASTSTSASELEFAPENESTPSTPLVQAIQSQEESVSAEGFSSQFEQLGDVFSDAAPPNAAALLQSDTDRVIQPGRLYIGGLPFSMKGDELKDGLRELCAKYGTVTDVSLAQHRHQSQKSILAGKHRGFAFVMMETPEQAQAVIDNLNGTPMWGRHLMVSYGLKKIEPDPSEEKVTSTEKVAVRCKVFIGNLHEGTSRKDLSTKFQQYGTVVDVKLITELHSSRSRGFGFVTFAEEGQAIRAVLDCDGSILDGSVIRVNIAKYPQGY